MNNDGRYVFPDSLRSAYEAIPFPLGVYQFVGGKVVTLLVSDGMCEFMGASRDALVNHYDENMFGNVHPDDREMLAALGGRFAVKEGPYDVVYRDRRAESGEYRYVHTIGKYRTMGDGSRVAFLTYADITESVGRLVTAFDEASSPQARFLDENGMAMIVVAESDRRVLYSNKAAKRMLPPQLPYDSYITFQDYFYHDIPGGMQGLLDKVNAGPHAVVEPRTGRRVEADVTEAQWGDERAYVMRLSEIVSPGGADGVDLGPAADELHRRRLTFNDVMFSGEGNGLSYWQRGYEGIRVWDLTANRMVASSGSDFLQRAYGEGMTYDEYLGRVAGGAMCGGDELRRCYCREALLLGFEDGIQPPGATVELRSPEGPAFIRTHFILRRSPDNGDVFLRLSEENVTEREVGERLIEATVSREFDFIAYVDIEGNSCHMVFGADAAGQRSFTVRLDEYCPTLSALVGGDFRTLEGLEGFVRESCADNGEFVGSFELEGGGVKSVRISALDPEHRIYYLRRSDVTELIGNERRREAELADAKLKADRANELKSSFLAGMSHDLRTPLNGIIGFTNFALEEPDPEVARGYMEKVRASADLLQGIVNDTLDLSRIESGKEVVEEELTSATDAASAVVEALRPMAEERDIRLVSGPYPDGLARIDKLKHQKILLNLVSNAIKYTPRGGTVKVYVETIAPPVAGHNRRIVVEDDGIGMGEEFQKVMFDPFSQERRSETAGTQGTGLGLSIVKRTVDLLGGSIKVRSAPGKGTRFEVEFAIVPADGVEVSPEGETSAEGPRLAGARVLLCEDNETNAEIERMLLMREGMEVDWARTGAEGLELFGASAPGTYAAILMDGRMPVMDGYEAARRIRRLSRPDAASVPIVAITADAFEENVRACYDAGMNAHVAKPIVPDVLFGTLRDLVRRP